MGYTHYWTFERPITRPEMVGLAEDVEAIILASGIPLAYEYDEPTIPPQVADEAIHFNGIEEDGHETFGIRVGAEGFDFCKTAAKPYDVVVVASLAALKDRLGSDVRISSDGDAADWRDGVALAERATGRPIESPIIDGAEDE